MKKELIHNITTTEYHLWTDVLHARKLSHQARNEWDRSSYVRWCIITGWTVLELVFRKVLNDDSIGHRFKQDVSKVIEKLGLPKINWGEGSWQKIISLRDIRNKYIHTKLERGSLFLESAFADKYVSGVQEGIISIYNHSKKSAPNCVYYMDDRGWDDGNQSMEHATVIRKGASIQNSESIIVSYIYEGREHVSEILPFDSDYMEVIQELIDRIKIPITLIKVYHNGRVIFEEQVIIRGT